MSDAWDDGGATKGIARPALARAAGGQARLGRIPILSDLGYAVVGSRGMWKLVALRRTASRWTSPPARAAA
jgi:hypothetical protein